MAKRSATELFEHYYTALVYSLPIKDTDFINELFKHDLLPGNLKIKLNSLTVQNERSSYFLDNVVKPGLAVGNRKCFVNLLTVMKCNQHDNVKDLAREMEKELANDAKYSSKPLLKDLHNIVVPKVANKWYELGIQLFSEPQLPRLDEIRAIYSNDHRGRCVEMLKCWLDLTPGAIWDHLINALRAPSLELLSIADSVEQEVKILCDVTKDQTESSSTGKCVKVSIQQLDSLNKLQSQYTQDHPDTYTEKFEDEDVVGAFAYLFYQLRILFGEVNFTQLKSACIQRGTLLPSEFKQQVKAAVELDDLLDALDNPMYCNWLNIRVLKRIVKTIDIQEAKHLIQAYEKCVYSRKVSDVEMYFHSDYFKQSHVSLVNAKILKSFESLIVADVIKYCEKLESNMGVYAGSITATEFQPGCLLITCVIPIHCALHAYETARTNFLKFRQFHIQYVEIDSFPKVFALNFSQVDNLTPASDDSQLISHHDYTFLENYMDADSVSHMMHCEHLITDNDYEAITAAPNDNKMNVLILQYVRSMNLTQMSRFCDILESIETHNILIEDCSSSFFQGSLQKLCTDGRVSTSKQLMASLIEYMKISEVNLVFYDLIDHLYLHLSATEKFSVDLYKMCSDINPPFTEQWLKRISGCKSLHLFIIYLLPFMTWFDHSILKELVAASGSEDARQLLDLFNSKVNSYSNQPITSFPILSPSQLMIPLDDSEYAMLGMKIFPPTQDDASQSVIVLQDVMDIKLTMKHKWKMDSHQIQLVAVHTKFKILYWMIPKSIIEVIRSNLIHDWKSGIIIMSVLPTNLEVNRGNREGLLNFLWQDDAEEWLKLLQAERKCTKEKVNILQEQKAACITQLHHEISEMSSRITVLQMENTKLKEGNKKLAKHFGQKKADQTPTSPTLLKQPTMSEDTLDKSMKSHQSQNKDSSKLSMQKLMNIVSLIQEKWSLIGIRLKLSTDKLDDIWQAASEQQISAESRNTFCCVKMLKNWYETSDNVSVDAVIMAVDAPHVGLKTKISSIETALTSQYLPMDSIAGTSATMPPEKLEQSYFDMITKFCLELSKSQLSISNILVYLKICKVNTDVGKDVSDFPELVRSFEKHKLVNKTDLSWLKNIAHHAKCPNVTDIIEEYESMLLADKIPWHSGHPKGIYLVGKTDKKSENVTIKDSSNAKSAASKIVNIRETDSILDYSEVGSIIFYWRIVNTSIRVEIAKDPDLSLIMQCKHANLTHVGIMIDGNLNWTVIDDIRRLRYPLFVGIHDYHSGAIDSLSFNKGDLLYIINGGYDRFLWYAKSKHTGKEGCIPYNYVAAAENKVPEEWFFGAVTRAQAENLLTLPFNDIGSFLVRSSKNTSSGYAISVRSIQKVEHYAIVTLHGRSFGIFKKVFPTIPELIWYYKMQEGSSSIILKSPCKMQTTSMFREANEDWEIERKAICLLMKLDVGNYAEMWMGKLNNTIEVTVKICKLDSMATNKVHDEISFMKKLRHPNVLQLYAVCTKEEPIYIITELMKHGSLLEYLRDDNGLLLKLPELLDVGEQVASGMSYLEKSNYVHRDLSAKNILVSENLISKVANFGLARVTNEGVFKESSNEKFSIKWLAPEAAVYGHFTNKSDVWSFGILLYELITYGGVPYYEMSNAQVIKELQRGYRMPAPVDCPDYLHEIMRDCWRDDPASRPTFESLLNQWTLEKFFTEYEPTHVNLFEEFGRLIK